MSNDEINRHSAEIIYLADFAQGKVDAERRDVAPPSIGDQMALQDKWFLQEYRRLEAAGHYDALDQLHEEQAYQELLFLEFEQETRERLAARLRDELVTPNSAVCEALGVASVRDLLWLLEGKPLDRAFTRVG